MNPLINDRARLQLNSMMEASNFEDPTPLIRQLKHSVVLRKDIAKLVLLREKYRDAPEELPLEAMIECEFITTYYTDIYNKIRKDEIDLGMLNDFLDVLKRVEDGEIDQTEAAVHVGTVLKKMYVDSALRKADKLVDMSVPVAPIEFKCISWKAYKSVRKSGLN